MTVSVRAYVEDRDRVLGTHSHRVAGDPVAAVEGILEAAGISYLLVLLPQDETDGGAWLFAPRLTAVSGGRPS